MRKTDLILFISLAVLVSGCTSTNSAPTESAKKDVPVNFVHVLDVKNNTSVRRAAEAVRNRLNIYGITYVQIQPVQEGNNSSVLVYTPDDKVSEIKDMLKPVNLHASTNVYLSQDSTLRLSENHSVSFSQDSLNISGTRIAKGESGSVGNVELTYNGVTDENYANVTAEIFDSSDILQVNEDQMRVTRSGGGYDYSFPITLEEEAAVRMRNLARNFEAAQSGMLENSLGESATMDIFFRGKKLSSLVISSTFQNQVIRKPNIQGSSATESSARSTANELVASIQAGELPEGIELVSVNPVNSSNISVR